MNDDDRKIYLEKNESGRERIVMHDPSGVLLGAKLPTDNKIDAILDFSECDNTLDTPVCRLALASLLYLLDEHDEVAKAELGKLTPGHPNGENWILRLDVVRPRMREMLEGGSVLSEFPYLLNFAILSSNAGLAAQVWPDTDRSLTGLGNLQMLSHEYADQCRKREDIADAAGFLRYLRQYASFW